MNKNLKYALGLILLSSLWYLWAIQIDVLHASSSLQQCYFISLSLCIAFSLYKICRPFFKQSSDLEGESVNLAYKGIDQRDFFKHMLMLVFYAAVLLCIWNLGSLLTFCAFLAVPMILLSRLPHDVMHTTLPISIPWKKWFKATAYLLGIAGLSAAIWYAVYSILQSFDLMQPMMPLHTGFWMSMLITSVIIFRGVLNTSHDACHTENDMYQQRQSQSSNVGISLCCVALIGASVGLGFVDPTWSFALAMIFVIPLSTVVPCVFMQPMNVLLASKQREPMNTVGRYGFSPLGKSPESPGMTGET